MDIEAEGLEKQSTTMDEEKNAGEGEAQPEGAGPMDLEIQRLNSTVGSPKLAKSLSIRNNSLIEKLFFGTMTSQYLVEGQQEAIAGEDALFGPILLDPTTNYFYKSWENYFYNQIENFRESKDRAAKWDLVRRFPDILCFQIQRARYNAERKCPEKNNQRFEFDQEIFVDRFLYTNRDAVQSMRVRADQLEAERLKIEAELKAISGFRDGRDIIKSLDDVLRLLQVMDGQDGQQPPLPPSILQFALEGKPQIAAALGSLRTGLEEEKQALQARRHAIEAETRTMYADIERTKYVVFSIIVHEGSADSGHFYCFVRMQDKWFKFNDFYVREMATEEVFETAFGSDGSVANAYCVFYMREDMFANCPPHDFARLGESAHGYYEFIGADKLFNIRQANLSFEHEIYASQVKKINAEYITRHDFVTRHFKDRYDCWKGKVTGMRSVCDFFLRRPP